MGLVFEGNGDYFCGDWILVRVIFGIIEVGEGLVFWVWGCGKYWGGC